MNLKNTIQQRGLLLFAVCLLGACSAGPDALVVPQVNNTIAAGDVAAAVTQNNVPADNYTTAEISVQLDAAALAAARAGSVSFTAEKGTFANGAAVYTVPVASDGLSKGLLKYNKADAVSVTVTVGGLYSKTLSVQFVTALPDQVNLETDSPVLTNSGNPKAGIKATLIRLNGLPSLNQAVTYYDSTATNGKSIGTFLNATATDANGAATASYVVQDTTFKGYVYIMGYVPAGAKKVLGKTRILLK